MRAATTKSALITFTEREFSRLATVLTSINETEALDQRETGLSIKDMLSERVHAIRLFLRVYEDGQAGASRLVAGKGGKWNHLKRYDAAQRQQSGGPSWRDTKIALVSANADLLTFLYDQTNVALFARPMTGGNGTWTAGEYVNAAGPAAYRSARAWIRTCQLADPAPMPWLSDLAQTANRVRL